MRSSLYIYTLPIKKNIDSRQRTHSSKSNTEFGIEFKNQLPYVKSCVCIIGDIVCFFALLPKKTPNHKYVRCDGVEKNEKVRNKKLYYTILMFADDKK